MRWFLWRICWFVPIWNNKNQYSHSCRAATWYYQVLFIHQPMHQWAVLKNNIKIYIKIYIKTAPTCFSVTVTPSSGNALICAYCLLPSSATYRHQYGPNICSHTTNVSKAHRCILMGYLNNCNFSKHELMRSLMTV